MELPHKTENPSWPSALRLPCFQRKPHPPPGNETRDVSTPPASLEVCFAPAPLFYLSVELPTGKIYCTVYSIATGSALAALCFRLKTQLPSLLEQLVQFRLPSRGAPPCVLAPCRVPIWPNTLLLRCVVCFCGNGSHTPDHGALA